MNIFFVAIALYFYAFFKKKLPSYLSKKYINFSFFNRDPSLSYLSKTNGFENIGFPEVALQAALSPPLSDWLPRPPPIFFVWQVVAQVDGGAGHRPLSRDNSKALVSDH
jgi:hypothetical protein